MTYDRNYSWAKDYKERLIVIAHDNNFTISREETINVGDIKRSTEKRLQIRLQKALTVIELEKHHHEYGEKTTLTSNNSNAYLNFKAWCLDDYLIGIEIEYRNLDSTSINTLKQQCNKEFRNYKIVWTEL